jgi:hypothetical protein
MKNEGSLGPKDISPEWNEARGFWTTIQEVGASLWAIWYLNSYEHDINVVDTFINKGMFGEPKVKLKLMIDWKILWITTPCVRITLTYMGNLLEFHNAKVISMSVYSDLDAMDENKFW